MNSPQAQAIMLSQRQQAVLKQIVRRTINPYRLVRRAQLILRAAAGASNSQLTRELKLERDYRVIHTRHTRWSESGVWEKVFKVLAPGC